MGKLFRGLAADGGVRVIAADTTDVVREALARQAASVTAGAAIGRTMTSAVLLAHVLLKAPGDRVTVRLSGDGPLGAVTADAGLDHTVRGYAVHPEVELPPRADGKLDVGGAVGVNGDVHVIRSHAPYGDPYTASVALTSGEVGEDIATYLAVSEQIPSAVLVGVHFTPALVVNVAGGVILQALPGADPAALTLLEANVKEFGALTAAMQRAPLLELVENELCWGLGFELLTDPPLDVRFECRCSDQSALEALAYFTPAERAAMIAEDGGAEVVCHWCGERRWIDADAMATLEGEELRCADCGTLWHRDGQPRAYRQGELCSCGRPVELVS
ncbi:MAG TPA: Hsp33 family molecular chaperone HslO [Trueperaceae bacterium]|nr:Hsp33 family molecular chaperone HslO [Trueperaceae bacterium]